MFTLYSLMLLGASPGQMPQPVHPFPDVPRTHWAYAAVTELHERGILQGYPGYYDRSTPYAALHSLIKAIHNDDDAMIQELTSSEWRERWIEQMKIRYPDARKRSAQLREYSERWLHASPYATQDWQSFHAEAQKAPPGKEVVFPVRRLVYTFVREPAGWKIVRILSFW